MSKITLITVTGLTASDSSYVASGATVKFDTILQANGEVRVYPKIYRDETAYLSGYTYVYMRSEDFPDDIIIATLDDDGLYNLTTTQLYTKVKNELNAVLGGTYVDVQIET